MRVHLLAPPISQTTAAYDLDGFTVATIRFANVLTRLGAEVLLYASEENDAPCHELVTVIGKDEQAKLLKGSPYQYAEVAADEACMRRARPRIIDAIRARQQPRDVICTISGRAHQPIAAAFPKLMTVEYSIGYEGSFAPYRVFESEAWRHWTYGKQGEKNGRFFDAVIPYFFDVAEYPIGLAKEPFALYVGRLTPAKGLEVAIAAAALAGMPLKVIGHGATHAVPPDASEVEFLGAVSTPERNTWMARASVVICPTLYLEPFGAVAVEAQLCGTPVVATDFGAFTETVEDGVTGFRCHYLGEFATALRHAGALDPTIIRARARRLYSLEAAAEAYARYFARLALLWDRGWETA